MLNRNKNKIILTVKILLIQSFLQSCVNSNNDYEQLQKNPVKTKAVIINKKYYLPNSPVSHEFYYYYQFDIGGRTFVGNSGSSHFKVGDSIEVEYLKTNPEINAIFDK
ncbi:MAG: hypothetical protein AAGC65_01800 [Mucilaginibacter sp.]|uniref:hypothetical protein n=1 Tax=Mucilaginibacter sp. TaxID=1882438 RepID=UPI0031AF82E4